MKVLGREELWVFECDTTEKRQNDEGFWQETTGEIEGFTLPSAYFLFLSFQCICFLKRHSHYSNIPPILKPTQHMTNATSHNLTS